EVVIALGEQYDNPVMLGQGHIDHTPQYADRAADDLGESTVLVEDMPVGRCHREHAVAMQKIPELIHKAHSSRRATLDHVSEAADQSALGNLHVPIGSALAMPCQHAYVAVRQRVDIA